MDRIIAYKGLKFTIAYARLRSGQSPGADYFDALPLEDKAKLMNLFRLAGDHASFSNDQKFGDLGGGLYEFKPFQVRMPFAYASQRGLIPITHGFFKKKNKTPNEEIERAWKMFKEDQEQTKLGLVKKRNK